MFRRRQARGVQGERPEAASGTSFMKSPRRLVLPARRGGSPPGLVSRLTRDVRNAERRPILLRAYAETKEKESPPREPTGPPVSARKIPFPGPRDGWALNPHPTLIPAIESGWVKQIHSPGSEVGMDAYMRARSDIYFTGRDGSMNWSPSRQIRSPGLIIARMADERPNYPYTFSDGDFVYGTADKKTAEREHNLHAAIALSGSNAMRLQGAVVMPSASRPSSIVINRSPLKAGLSSSVK